MKNYEKEIEKAAKEMNGETEVIAYLAKAGHINTSLVGYNKEAYLDLFSREAIEGAKQAGKFDEMVKICSIAHDIMDAVDDLADLNMTKLTKDQAEEIEKTHNVYIDIDADMYTTGNRDDDYGWLTIPEEWLPTKGGL